MQTHVGRDTMISHNVNKTSHSNNQGHLSQSPVKLTKEHSNLLYFEPQQTSLESDDYFKKPTRPKPKQNPGTLGQLQDCLQVLD